MLTPPGNTWLFDSECCHHIHIHVHLRHICDQTTPKAPYSASTPDDTCLLIKFGGYVSTYQLFLKQPLSLFSISQLCNRFTVTFS